MLEKFANKFGCEPTIHMIPVKLFRFKLGVLSSKYVNIWIFFQMHYKNIQHIIMIRYASQSMSIF